MTGGTLADQAKAQAGPWMGYALALVAVAAFSVRPVLVRLGYAAGGDAETLLALRMILSLPFFLAMGVAGSRRAAAATSARMLAAAAALGLLGYYAASYMDMLGLRTVHAGLGRLILFLYPTFTLALSAWFLGKRPSRRDILCLILAYAGLVLVVGSGWDGNVEPAGAAFILAGAVFYAGYLVGSSAVVTATGSLRFAAIAMAAATIASVGQFLVLRPVSALLTSTPVLLIALAIALVSTVLPVWATAEALRRIGANRVAIMGALGPVTTIALAWIGLDETLSLPQILGAVLVLGGVMLLTTKR
jgi:drug/metabolite transporter (DMT)-like permease